MPRFPSLELKPRVWFNTDMVSRNFIFPGLIAVVMNNWSPQIIGLEWPKPGITVFHRTFSDFSMFQAVAVSAPLAMPLAWVPRKEGQFVCAIAGNASTSTSNGILE